MIGSIHRGDIYRKHMFDIVLGLPKNPVKVRGTHGPSLPPSTDRRTRSSACASLASGSKP